MTEKTTGILLQSIPYLGQQKILKVFTPEFGTLSLILKSTKPSWNALTIPFCIAEWVYKKGQKEIHLLRDGSLIDGLLELKQNYEVLEAAGLMAQDILRSQLPEKQAHGLYELFCAYLKKLPFFERPEILTASFKLKLLLHEGLFEAETSTPLPPFTAVEWAILQQLAFSRQFSQLQAIAVAPCEKITNFFDERMKM